VSILSGHLAHFSRSGPGISRHNKLVRTRHGNLRRAFHRESSAGLACARLSFSPPVRARGHRKRSLTVAGIADHRAIHNRLRLVASFQAAFSFDAELFKLSPAAQGFPFPAARGAPGEDASTAACSALTDGVCPSRGRVANTSRHRPSISKAPCEQLSGKNSCVRCLGSQPSASANQSSWIFQFAAARKNLPQVP